MLDVAVDTIAATSGTVTSGADAQILAANTERNALRISLDSAAAGPVYLLLGAGVASATNFHICLAAGQYWDGNLSEALWRGAVRCFGTGGKLGVVEA